MSQKKIIVALDSDNLNNAISLVKKLKNDIYAFKIGYEFFLNFGINGYRSIQQENVKIFFDLKSPWYLRSTSKYGSKIAKISTF